MRWRPARSFRTRGQHDGFSDSQKENPAALICEESEKHRKNNNTGDSGKGRGQRPTLSPKSVGLSVGKTGNSRQERTKQTRPEKRHPLPRTPSSDPCRPSYPYLRSFPMGAVKHLPPGCGLAPGEQARSRSPAGPKRQELSFWGKINEKRTNRCYHPKGYPIFRQAPTAQGFTLPSGGAIQGGAIT